MALMFLSRQDGRDRKARGAEDCQYGRLKIPLYP